MAEVIRSYQQLSEKIYSDYFANIHPSELTAEIYDGAVSEGMIDIDELEDNMFYEGRQGVAQWHEDKQMFELMIHHLLTYELYYFTAMDFVPTAARPDWRP